MRDALERNAGIRSFRRTAAVLLLTSASGCGVVLGSDGACRGGVGSVHICVDRSEYGPGSTLRLTMTNQSEEPVYLDGCALVLAERTALELFGFEYDAARRCGSDFTLEDVLERMDEILPSETRTRSITVPAGLPQGFYRVLQWRLDAEGMPPPEQPLQSPEFDVFPSAN